MHKKEILPVLEPYHVIIGCFSEKNNAEGLVKNWEENEYQPQIIDKHNGLYRVSIKSFTLKEQAIDFRKKLKEEQHLSAWVLKK